MIPRSLISAFQTLNIKPVWVVVLLSRLVVQQIPLRYPLKSISSILPVEIFPMRIEIGFLFLHAFLGMEYIIANVQSSLQKYRQLDRTVTFYFHITPSTVAKDTDLL